MNQPAPPTPPQSSPVIDLIQNFNASRTVLAVYILYLFAMPLVVPMIVGVGIAYLRSHSESEDWMHSHHRWQIRTFWYFSACFLAASVLTFAILISGTYVLGSGPPTMNAAMQWLASMTTPEEYIAASTAWLIFLAPITWFFYRNARGLLLWIKQKPVPGFKPDEQPGEAATQTSPDKEAENPDG
ncbi:MAG: hypothetical protein ISN29_01295 [Gammaproteobacteria bacterium AqS3]|nr:hypothetical protein [Gammaproteobacteria bacterium AqS3]